MRENAKKHSETGDNNESSKNTYQVLFHKNPYAMIVHDGQHVLEVNEAAVKLLGPAEPEEFVNRPCLDFVPPAWRNTVQQRIAEARQGKEASPIPQQITTLNGQIVDIEARTIRFDQNGKTVLITTLHDISEREKAYLAVQRSEKRYRNLVETLNEGIWEIDADANTTLVNNRMAEMLGYTPDEMAGRHLFDFMTEENIEICKRNLAKRQAGKAEHHEFIFQHKNGSPVYTLLGTCPIYDENGCYTGALAGISDISELKMAEQELRKAKSSEDRQAKKAQETEVRFKIMFDNAPDAILLADPESGTILDANKQASEMLGRPINEIRGMHQADLHPPEQAAYSREAFNEHVQQTTRGEAIQRIENSFVRPDGTRIPVECTAQVVPLAGQQVLMGIFRNVSDRRKLEKHLRITQRAVDRAPIEIYGILPNGRFFFVNDTACKRTGYNREELLSMRVSDLDPEYPANRRKTLWERLKREGSMSFESRHRSQDGIDTPLLIRNHYLKSDNEEFEFAYALDITQQKQAMDALRKISECFMQFGTDPVYNLNLITQTAGEILDATCVLYNRRDGELLKTLTGWHIPDDMPREDQGAGHICFEIITQNRRDPIIIRDLQNTPFGQSDPNVLKYNLQTYVAQPIMLDDQPIASLCAVFLDDRQPSPVLIDLLQMLGRAATIEEERKLVQEELVKARDEAEAASQAKNVFLANMSHELRTPLNPIMGFTDLILRDSNLTNDQRESLQMVKQRSRDLLQLLSDILDITRIEANRLSIQPQPTNIRSLLSETVMLFEREASTKGIHIGTEVSSTLPRTILVDPARVRQILLNLVGNAIKFTDQGSVGVIIKETQDPVSDSQPGGLRITVSDTGCGIEPEQLAHIFKAFHQADNSSTREYGGAGLGLSICQRITDLMQGTITAKSTPAQGSTFEVTLPCRFPQPQQGSDDRAQRTEAEPDSTNAKLNVLMVEDEPSNMLIHQKMLEQLGHDMTCVTNGSEAIEACQSRSFDLILMDIKMPIMDGLEATRQIRNIEQHRETPIIAMTAYAFEEDRKACLAAGMNDWIPKPIRMKTLVKSIEQHCINPG